MEDSSDIVGDAAVLPAYKEIYGKPCSPSDLVAVLQRHNVKDWLCNLARLACVLAGNRHRDEKWYRPFLKSLVPERLYERLEAWDREQQSAGRKVAIFTERYVGILAELALVHASEDVGCAMECPGDGSIFDALLMVASLEEPDHSRLSPTPDFREGASVLSALWFRSLCPDPRWLAARGFYVFKILQERAPGSWAQKWADLFRDATGRDIDAYYVGGFQSLAVAWGRSVDELAKGWEGLPSGPEQANLPHQWESFDAYYGVRRGDIPTIRGMIVETKDVSELDDVSLIPLLTYPIVRFPDGCTYPLFLKGIGESLYEGIYYAVGNEARDAGGKLNETRQDIGAVFGYLFEAYILDVVEKSFGDRLLRNPRREDNGEEAADGIILCPGGIIVLQIKGGHVPVRHRYLPKSPDDLLVELGKSGLDRACQQVARSVEGCREGMVAEVSKYARSLDTLRIQPMIVTHEEIPVFGLSHHLLDETLKAAQPDQFTRRPILVNPGDIEAVAGLPPSDDIWGVLTEYVSESKWRKTSFHNFLGNTGRGGKEVISGRLKATTRAVWEYLGMSGDPGLDTGASGTGP